MVDEYRTQAQFKRGLPAELDALRAALAREGALEASVLDLSYASLDALEPLARDVAAGKVLATQREDALTRIGWYAGETLVKQTGAWWRMGVRSTGRPMPCVTRIPLLDEQEVYPHEIIKHGTRASFPGWLREAVEIHDLHLRRELAEHLIEEIDTELAAFRKDVQALFGLELPAQPERGALGSVQDSLARSTRLDEALPAQRTFQQRAALYVGTLLRRELGRGRWSLCEEARRLELGQLCVDEWAPIRVVRRMSPEVPAGGLLEAFERELGARR